MPQLHANLGRWPRLFHFAPLRLRREPYTLTINEVCERICFD